jgi:selenocysteine lyase/cysteine desulfurase
MTDWVYLDASLAYLEGIGFERVRDRIRSLASRLSQGLRTAGFSLAADASTLAPTGIVVASKPGLDSAGAVRSLKAGNIIAAERLGRIRLAPHIYISEEQIDTVVEALRSL